MNWIVVRRAKNRRQAEEFQLALNSFEIGSRVTHEPDELSFPLQPWIVEVEADDLAAAQRIMAEHEAESAIKPIPIESVPFSGVGYYWVVGLAILNFLVWWLMEQSGGSEDHATLLRFGAITSDRLLGGEGWRSVTAIFLHIGLSHFLGNTALLLVLGGIGLKAWGPGRLLLVYVVSGVAGNWISCFAGAAHVLKAGASGAILGWLGGLAGARLRQILHPDPHSRFKVWHVLGMLIAFYGMAVGVQPNSDHAAHIGAILVGGLLVGVWPPVGRNRRELVLQWSMGSIALGVAIAGAGLAYRAAFQ